MQRLTILVPVLFLAACGGTPLDVEEDALTATSTLGPQSLTHGTLGASKKQLAYNIQGKAGDVIAPDVWPTASSAMTPALTLQGPKASNGRRATLATGTPRGTDPRHLAIDGFRLPTSGSYLLLVGIAPGGKGGKFSLRLWMQSSHLPRQEGSQADLSLTPSAAASAAISAHGQSPHPWTDAEVDVLVADMLQQKDPRIAVSTGQILLSALASPQATGAQRTLAAVGVAQVIGTQRHFRALDPQTQALALWWLGNADGLFFATSPGAPPRSVGDTVAQLVAAWPGAQEDLGERQVQAKVRNGVVYGWQVEWRASQADLDGTQVWEDFAHEWFDSAGNWLAEQSQGASEPDDD